MMRRVADAIAIDPAVALEIAHTLYAECVLRTMYGVGFLTGSAETETAFQARLARTAVARALAG